MSAKCTKELIVESITNAINTQPQTETAKVFKSTVNNFVGYIAELGINNSQDLNVHIPKADVFAPYLHKIGEVLNEGNKLFLVKNRITSVYYIFIDTQIIRSIFVITKKFFLLK